MQCGSPIQMSQFCPAPHGYGGPKRQRRYLGHQPDLTRFFDWLLMADFVANKILRIRASNIDSRSGA
jgi:hypothetical protein